MIQTHCWNLCLHLTDFSKINQAAWGNFCSHAILLGFFFLPVIKTNKLILAQSFLFYLSSCWPLAMLCVWRWSCRRQPGRKCRRARASWRHSRLVSHSCPGCRCIDGSRSSVNQDRPAQCYRNHHWHRMREEPVKNLHLLHLCLKQVSHKLTSMGWTWLGPGNFPGIQQQPGEGQQAETGSAGSSTGDPRRPLPGPVTYITGNT